MKTKLITLLIAITTIIGSAYAQKKIEVYKNGEVVYSEYITDIDSIKFKEHTAPLPGTENGHEYVDLGLPSGIKWATCNVGATSPEEYGDYFAWGETAPKDSYYWDTYKYCNGTYDTLTKYCRKSDYGTVDNKNTLELEDDAARINWGGNWRMPTRAEQEELMDTNNCTWEWTTQNGVNGYKVTSKKNGNSIFLPAAGYRYLGKLYEAGSDSFYWSSSLGQGYGDSAYDLRFNSSYVYWVNSSRDFGLSVRAVCDLSTPTPSPIVCTVSVSATEGGTAVASATEVKDGETVTLTATPNEGYRFVNWTVNGEVVSIENPFTATITADTEFVANFEIALSESAGTENGYEYVDLGLPSGVKWATCNVGATAPEEYGDYFAWGETAPKTTYNWSSYKYCNGTETSLTKYCVSSSYGIVDNRTILGLEDDAANANWGGNWRMPTEAEQDELRNTDNCTWEWTTQNGVNGYKVISKINGNSIFLPAAGYYNGNKLYSAGDHGDYWSGSLSTSNRNYACGLDFYSSSVRWSGKYRCYGGPVRAVYAPLQTYTISVLTADATMGSVTTSATELEYAETVILTATSNEGYKFGYWTVNGEIVSTENPYTATITANKEFVANFVTSLSDSNGTENGYEYVDLGLPSGIKWATCNVGATAPEEYGGYYAWGETNRKTVYDWSTYKYCNDSYVTLTKYCTDSSYGTVDNKTVLELEDDAARINWGGNWRMPTKEELDELKNTSNCIWEWTTKNGVNGYKVTSKVNANSIFLPAAGYCGNGYISGAGSNSYYWSSSLYSYYSDRAYSLSFYSSSVDWSIGYRCGGKSVRAVCP